MYVVSVPERTDCIIACEKENINSIASLFCFLTGLKDVKTFSSTSSRVFFPQEEM